MNTHNHKTQPPINSGGRTIHVDNLPLALFDGALNLALQALAYLTLAATGAYVEIGLLRTGETRTKYRIPRGGHALTCVAVFGNTVVIGGTPGVTDNPGFSKALNFALAMMRMAGKIATFLSPATADNQVYLRDASGRMKPITNWGFETLSIIVDVELNVRGLLARIAGTNTVYFLSAEQVAKGRTSKRNWTRANVPGITSLDSLPTVIDDVTNVFCRVTSGDGEIGATTLNLRDINSGTIENTGFEATSETAWVAGRTATGDVVVVNDGASGQFNPGVSVVPPTQFAAAFGDAGRRYTGTAASAQA